MEELRIKEMMSAKGVTQKDVADALGISQAAVAMRLKSPSQKSLQEFASVLNCSVSDFYVGVDKGSEEGDKSVLVTTCPCCGAQLRITLQPLQPQPAKQEQPATEQEQE